MTAKEALKRLKQETAPATYMPDFDKDECIEIINQELDRLEKLEIQLKDGTLSDGYHTFNDLYIQRMYLFATIVNQNKELAWKSLKHEDGELCFGGNWFVVGIDTPKGSYTYHYENKYWDLFNCKELEVAKHWDGHTSKDVDRLLSLKKDTQLEKELKQTKLNFKNSQTHSKNCYKKLKEKFERGKEVYHRNYELIQENGKLKQENQELKEKNLKISIENNNSKIVEEMNKTVVENKNKQLLEATELNITYLDKIIMLKKAIKLLKEYIMYEELDEILEKYPDLKEVLKNE